MSTPISVKASPVIGLPSLPAPSIDGALNANGLISANMANFGVTLRCPVGFADPEDWIEIQQRSLNPTTNWVTVTNAASGQDFEQMGAGLVNNEYTKFFPAPSNTGAFPHGKYEYRFILFLNVRDPAGVLPDRPEAASEYSLTGPMDVDWFAPYQRLSGKDTPPALVSTNTWAPGTTVTLAQINAEGGLKFNVPDNRYGVLSGQWAPRDSVKFFVAQGTNPVVQQELAPLTPPRDFTQTGNSVIFQASDFAPLDGTVRIFYTLTDESGNVSAPSAPFNVTLSLVADPIPLAPVVPLAPDATDNLINVTDYENNPEVHVLDYLNRQIGEDAIELLIGSQPAITLPLTAVPLVFNTLKAALRAEYGNRTGPLLVNIRYNVLRNGQRFPSPVTPITLNLGVRGAINPGEPGSRNTALNLMHVLGSRSPVADTLEKIDANLPTFGEVVLWTGPEQPVPGQFIFAVIDGTVVQPGFPITTELPGATIRVPIDWTYWDTAGNGPHQVHYFVASSATPDPLENLNTSLDTTVSVNGAVTTPLAPPQFLRPIAGRWTCDSLLILPDTNPQQFEGQIFVPPEARFVVGQTLFLDLRVYSPATGTPTISQVQTLQVPITAAIQASGHIFRVPFAFLKQVQNGALDASSRSTLAGGLIGDGSATIRLRPITFTLYCDKTVI